MRAYFLFFILFVSAASVSQKRGAEAGIITDNDLYTSTVNDRYYTNGLEFYYRYLNKSENEKVVKKITEFRIGQYVYTPRTREANNPIVNDRPFAGYLFAEIGRNVFYANESVFKSNLQLGVVGPNALGEDMQKVIHQLFGYKRVQGWQHQIRNTPAIQTNFLYSVKISPEKLTKFDSHFQSEANVGTIWNSLSTGIMSRISFKKQLLKMYNSNLHGASVNNDSKVYDDENEFYFYFMPGLNYQFYDATVEGSMFDDESPVTRDLVHLRFQAEAGVKYRKKKWNLSYAFIYRGMEIDYPRNVDYYYGSIGIGYMLN